MRLQEVYDNTIPEVNTTYIYTMETIPLESDDTSTQVFTTVQVKDEQNLSFYHYSIKTSTPLEIKIIEVGHPDHNDQNILKVRVLNNVDNKVCRFNKSSGQYYTDQSGEKICMHLKEIPQLDNLDLYTEKEFQEKYGHPRMLEDHGLVGYIYNNGQLTPKDKADTTSHHTTKPKAKKMTAFDDDFGKPDKLDLAVQIYKANRTRPRTEVVHTIQQQLNMSKAGASSYYTKAKHKVEDPN